MVEFELETRWMMSSALANQWLSMGANGEEELWNRVKQGRKEDVKHDALRERHCDAGIRDYG
ncbi:hypothetical protein PRIPAC_72144 [Pristionchus pacificus]|uniref:Uncharacterized protein n=1 Tax=Pristionchus pacificus TaxID=54126 RepID=A0A2A6C113_PRIPA|nr:hypothetical protein PRIPAC_72144 [Pristionchus pacificus]|eukprot:PDM71798.1 hypothetical protein PRIPAC_38205 [Pristionchus pacificus]